MIPAAFTWTDVQVRAALGIAEAPRPRLAFTGVSTDSRTVHPGDLYVALVGPRFDGHDFVEAALAAGARAAVVSRSVPPTEAPLYAVDDTLVALGRLASYRRARLDVPVIGITGSSGKTSTKDFTRGALGRALAVHATEGNLNNRIGVPITLLGTPAGAEAVVVEMGSNEPGEIGILTDIVRPTLGLLTTVGESHLEKLGSLEGVLDEKLDLLRGLPGEGAAVVGDVPAALAERARSLHGRTRVAGWSERADAELRPADVTVDERGAHSFSWRDATVSLRVPGRHAVENALLALAASEELGVAAAAAADGVSAVEPGWMRGQVARIGSLTLLLDCYNANPQSTRAALDTLELQDGARVAVLGSMLELGPDSDALHEDVLLAALRRDLDVVVATGEFARAARGLDTGRGRAALVTLDDPLDGYARLREILTGEEVVLLKASRGVALEGLLPLLSADFGGE